MTDDLVTTVSQIVVGCEVDQHVAILAEEHRLVEFRPVLRRLVEFNGTRVYTSRDVVEIRDIGLVIRLIAIEPMQQGNYCRMTGMTFTRVLIDILPDTLSDFSDDNLESMLSELSCHMREGKVEWFKS